MEYYTLILCAIVAVILLLLFTVCALILYSGLIDDVTVDVGQPPLFEGFYGMYKFGTGSYSNASFVFSEALSILPKLKTFGIYYDDPKQVEEQHLRWIAGSVIPKDLMESEDVKEAEKVFEENGFKKLEFPSMSLAVRSKFPFRSDLSIMFGAYKVYPQLKSYIQKNRLQAHPFLEYYGEEHIHYYAPLEHHDKFAVPEVTRSNDVLTETSKQD